jgi:hypothetical protein
LTAPFRPPARGFAGRGRPRRAARGLAGRARAPLAPAASDLFSIPTPCPPHRAGTSYMKVAPKTPAKYLADPVNTKSRPKGKVEFWVEGCRVNEKGKNECYPKVITTKHSWTTKGAPEGSVLITTEQTVGIPFKVAKAIEANEKRIVPNWANGQDVQKK